ncbi:MAG: YggS family pyridoxal phosphate-dependent enzyme [Bacillota bacterium]|nr:YggS family pyridoxal phosphate-dependent enzyme [Bacillota bacterium]
MPFELATPDKNDFLANLSQVRETIAKAAAACGRKESEITLAAVTKNFDISAGQMAVEAGLDVLCENRVQEAEWKYGESFPGKELHLIGHLQTNKAQKAVALADSIDSVDSLRLAEVLNIAAQKCHKTMPVLLEVNIGDDPAKSGISFSDIDDFCARISALEHISLRGLMTILPLGCGHKEKLDFFSKLYQKYIDIQNQRTYTDFSQLSMGMSDDYAEAVLCGATTLRIGTALFGKRH